MKHPVNIEPSWKKALSAEFDKPYWEKLADFIRAEYEQETVYPPPKFVFNAFSLCPFGDVRVVILGQDPYHGPKQAHGLSFSVRDDVDVPPSLQNIYKEIRNEFGKEIPDSGNLERWAKQGVLLLNATLTVRAGAAGSHQKKGWEEFTDAVIRAISEQKSHVVFILWGNYARAKGGVIDRTKHLVLESAHPSPLSAHHGFFGCGHFKAANRYLTENGLKEIEW